MFLYQTLNVRCRQLVSAGKAIMLSEANNMESTHAFPVTVAIDDVGVRRKVTSIISENLAGRLTGRGLRWVVGMQGVL
jgi:hypothetical protein